MLSNVRRRHGIGALTRTRWPALEVWWMDVKCALRLAWVRPDRSMWERTVDLVRDLVAAARHARLFHSIERERHDR